MIKNIFTPFLFTLLLSVGFTAPVQARAAIDLIDLDVRLFQSRLLVTCCMWLVLRTNSWQSIM